MTPLSPKNIVMIGGGTGSYTVLSGLKKIPNVSLTAVVTMSDNGGSTGKLRDELGVLPPGDARQCLVALSESPEILRELFTYRFDNGDLKGHNFGNLFLSALEKITGNFEEALETAAKVLSINGLVIPVTTTNVNLKMTLLDGEIIQGEDTIGNRSDISEKGVHSLSLYPEATVNPKAIKAILNADMVIIGPGNFYCSLIPNIIVPGIKEALAQTSATVVYNSNLMAKYEHCKDWSVEDFARNINSYLHPNTIDIILYNNKRPAPTLLDKYKSEGSFVNRKTSDTTFLGAQLIGADLLADTIVTTTSHDPIQRTLIRHDSHKIAQALYSLLK